MVFLLVIKNVVGDVDELDEDLVLTVDVECLLLYLDELSVLKLPIFQHFGRSFKILGLMTSNTWDSINALSTFKMSLTL